MRRFARTMLRAAFAAVAVMTAAVTAAAAYPASVTAHLNMRTGPGPRYPIIGTLPPGARVGVDRCASNWCWIRWGRLAGYVNNRYLASAYPGRPPVIVRPPQVRPPILHPPYWRGGFFFWHDGRSWHRDRDRDRWFDWRRRHGY